MAEMVIVVGMSAIALVASLRFMQNWIHNGRIRSCVREVHSIVLAARMQAVKRNTRAIVFFDLPNHRVLAWAENLPYNFTMDAGEVVIADYTLPGDAYFNRPPTGTVDDQYAVSFDTYGGSALLKDMLIYQGDGTLLNPEATYCVRPLAPSTYTAAVPSGSVNTVTSVGAARGVYISDSPSSNASDLRNTFRISVDDFGSNGRASILKWQPNGNAGEMDWVPQPWTFVQPN
jgi:hypothetical protein